MDKPGRKPKADKASGPTEVAPRLYIGSWNNVKDAAVMKDLGIRCIVNVAKELDSEPEKGSDVMYRKIVLDELEVLTGKGNFKELEEILTFIEEARQQNRPVLVHCLHGRSRSAFVVIGWMIKYERRTFRAAHDKLKAKRPQIAVPSQRALADFQKSLGV